MERRSAILAGVVAVGASATLYACNDIIGTRDLSFVADSDGSAGNDGSASGADGGVVGPDGGSASDGAASDGAVDSSTPCTDTTKDPNNCGRCGHSCLGGKCVPNGQGAGQCQPVPLASGLVNAISLAVDSQSVYWADNISGTVVSSNKAGTTLTLIATGLTTPWGVATDGTTVYIASFDDAAATGGIYACPVTQCNPLKPTRMIAQSQARWIAIGTPSQTLFTIEGSFVNRVDISKTPWTQTHIANANQGFHVTADANFAYFTDNANTIHRAPVAGDGGAVIDFGNSALNFAGDIVVDATNVYWTNGDIAPSAGKVWSLAKNGMGLATAYANTQPVPLGIATDGKTVFWVTQNTGSATDDGTVQSCPVAGCVTPTLLASNLPNPNSIVLDATAIYVACAGDNGINGADNGVILKLAKP